jgi:outer membrane protein assembly factor BamB
MTHPRGVFRAGALGLAGLALAVVGADRTATSVAPPEPEIVGGQVFVSRPDLSPPPIGVTTHVPARRAFPPGDDDLVFLGPKDGGVMTGPLIVDPRGDPVWVFPLEDGARAYDVRVQRYHGKPVLTWWDGLNLGVGYGYGHYVLMDQTYRIIATVKTRGSLADHHGMTLTDDGTALLITYRKIPYDLSAVGGPEDGYLVNCLAQEVDVETGKVVFQWSALDHVPITDTRVRVGPDSAIDGSEALPLDYFHMNSVTEDGDGHLLISARNTHAIYRIDRETGDVDWTLGGSSSDFRMLGDARFAWQHDAERRPDGTITLFDNEAGPKVGEQSRGLRLTVDPKTHTARVVTEYLPPDGRLSSSQGNLQERANGHVFIGWGGLPNYSEYTRDGRLLYDARILGGASYRAYRLPWVGRPFTDPALTVEDGVAYVSWNGATEVAQWRFLAGDDKASAEEIVTAPRTGFETSVPVPDTPYLAVQALDADGRVLGSQVR